MRIAIGWSLLLASTCCMAQSTRPTTLPGDNTVPLTISGGHETDPRDGGRPVILVASALGVPAQVFRDTFRNVHPAGGGGGPTPDQAKANKKVLIDGLAKYGVTNDRLDEVSNQYRYPPGSSSLWKHRPAKGSATVRDGKVVAITITDAGCGYTTPPTISVDGHPETKVAATLTFGKDFDTNGSVAAATLAN